MSFSLRPPAAGEKRDKVRTLAKINPNQLTAQSQRAGCPSHRKMNGTGILLAQIWNVSPVVVNLLKIQPKSMLMIKRKRLLTGFY